MQADKKMRVAVITKNAFLFQKIKLDLYGICEVTKTEDARPVGFDLCFFDIDSIDAEPHGITMSKSEDCTLPLPFLIGAARELVDSRTVRGLTLNKDERTAILHGVSVKLTDVEYALLYAIYSRRGEYASRADILREVWGDAQDAGIINVYVHYLREKLEGGGEKIIISSRNKGYAIDGKYFTGGGNFA